MKTTMTLTLLVVALSAAAVAQHEHHGAPAQAAPQAQRPAAPASIDAPPPRELPGLGAAAAASGPKVRLDELERMALENNPTLRQAQAEVRGAQGRARQAGLWPNPVVGYTGEELRGGRFGGGQHGGFVEQTIVLGGKLRRSRAVFQQEKRLAEIEAEEQRLRVVNGVRVAFYRALAAQEALANEREQARVAQQALETHERLRNLGQMDETEVLGARIEAQQAQIALSRAENRWRRAWASLAAVVGRPLLQPAALEGRLDGPAPALDEQQLIARLVGESPAVRIAEANVERSNAVRERARREAFPDLRLRAGLQQNNEELDGTPFRAGLQGFAEVGIALPIFNRNQGNVQSAAADAERAALERQRVELVLRERAAGTVQAYRDARVAVERYRDDILPAAQRAYQLMRERWGQMAAAYPQLLTTQRMYFRAQREYIAALEDLWTRSIALEGFLLTDALEAPARPGEVDQPVREINLPSPLGGGE